jgi:hypothetical protein
MSGPRSGDLGLVASRSEAFIKRFSVSAKEAQFQLTRGPVFRVGYEHIRVLLKVVTEGSECRITFQSSQNHGILGCTLFTHDSEALLLVFGLATHGCGRYGYSLLCHADPFRSPVFGLGCRALLFGLG